MLFKSPIFRGLTVSKTLAQLIVVHVSIRRRSSHATNTSLLYKRLTRQRKVLNSRYALVSGKAEMQSLQEKASQWSGVDPADAFAIDSTNLFEKLGLETFINLSTNFYTRVYDDEEEWFKSIFANSKKEEAIQNQYEFFVQRMGGPPLYSQRKGHPALIGRHKPFPVTHQAAERWLHHMQQALDSTPDIDADTRVKMMNFFRHTAFFLVAGNELKNPNQQVSCKHGASKPATAT